jgi:membrane fusion protein, copper/silver efflux system
MPTEPAQETPDRSVPGQTRFGVRLRWLVRMAQVRLRFPLVLLAAFLVIGRWEDLRNAWTRVSHVVAHANESDSPVSSDTEYFCPMDPGVVSNWPGKCGVCNMALVRRKKGEAIALPNGVIARMQISPYRLQLAGIKTIPVTYRALAQEREFAGRIVQLTPTARIESELASTDLADVMIGMAVDITVDDRSGISPHNGVVRTLREGGPTPAMASIELTDPPKSCRIGMPVRVKVHLPMASREPFRSMPSEIPPSRPNDPRSGYVCPEHPENLSLQSGRCPIDQNSLEKRPLLTNQRIFWWCPMHPRVEANHSGESCKECGGMTLVPRIVNYRPLNEVLAVPELAVIDTGRCTVVYVERMPGMFDGIEVVLGPRCGDYFPVIKGLEAEQKVAASGAFLIDAETRLNPSVAAAYFGAAKSSASSAEVGPPIAAKARCPVTRKPLGSMGPPVTVEVNGRKVSLCCDACEDKLRTNPAKYLGDFSEPAKRPQP